jgi:thioredoxin reductase
VLGLRNVSLPLNPNDRNTNTHQLPLLLLPRLRIPRRPGVLAIGTGADVMQAMHVAHNAAQLASTVTIYTHGNPALCARMSAAASKKPARFKVDDRRVVRLVKGPDAADVVVHLDDGAQKTEAFLVRRPLTEANGPFAGQLGCELTERGDYKTANGFGETSVHGVFAAGDCAAVIKAVTHAMSGGNMVAAGLAAQLEAEMEG